MMKPTLLDDWTYRVACVAQRESNHELLTSGRPQLTLSRTTNGDLLLRDTNEFERNCADLDAVVKALAEWETVHS